MYENFAVRLRKQLIEQEDEYGDILKGKSLKNKEDVLRELGNLFWRVTTFSTYGVLCKIWLII